LNDDDRNFASLYGGTTHFHRGERRDGAVIPHGCEPCQQIVGYGQVGAALVILETDKDNARLAMVGEIIRERASRLT
jgi:hypothetical protein